MSGGRGEADLGRRVEITLKPFCVYGRLWAPVGEAGLVVVSDARTGTFGGEIGRGGGVGDAIVHALRATGLGVLAVDLLTSEEGDVANEDSQCSADVQLLAGRFATAIDWARSGAGSVRLAACGIGAAGAPVLIAASERGELTAVVSVATRPTLAGESLRAVRAPALFVPLHDDQRTWADNERAHGFLAGPRALARRGDAAEIPATVAAWLAKRLGGTPVAAGVRQGAGRAAEVAPARAS